MNAEAPDATGLPIDASETFVLLGLLTEIMAAAVAAERTRLTFQGCDEVWDAAGRFAV